MRKIYTLFVLVLVCAVGTAQFRFKMEHLSIVVEDVDVSAAFYQDVLQLKETPHPDNKPGFRWFLVDEKSQIHLIQKEFTPFEKNKSMHLCLATNDLDGVIAHLEEQNIDYYDWPGKKNAVTLRTDGIKQIYLQDPDEYWIEINTATHED